MAFEVILNCVGGGVTPTVPIAVNNKPVGVTVVFGPPVKVVPTLGSNVAHTKGSVGVQVVCAFSVVLLKIEIIVAKSKHTVEE